MPVTGLKGHCTNEALWWISSSINLSECLKESMAAGHLCFVGLSDNERDELQSLVSF